MATKKPDPYKTDPDNPEWTAEDFAKAKPAAEVLAAHGITAPKPKIGRPKGRTKAQVTVSLDQDLIKALKGENSKGWQTRLNAAARKGLGLKVEG